MNLTAYASVALILISGIFYWYYHAASNRLDELHNVTTALEQTIAQDKIALDATKAAYQKQTNALTDLYVQNAKLSEDTKKLSDLLIQHDLNSLSIAKPGLIEERINNGTMHIFTTISNITK